MATVRRVLVVLAALAVASVLAASASASPPVTETITVKDTDTFVDVFPSCEDGPLYEITLDFNSVEHTTIFEDGRIHATFTTECTFKSLAGV